MKIDINNAYAQQRVFLANIQDKRIGYKIAFSSEVSQKTFGLTEPAFGILFQSMQVKPNSVLLLKDFTQLRLENEIAFILGGDVPEKVRSIDMLKPFVESVAPAIEAPDFHFPKTQQTHGFNIIACNCIASRFLLGKKSFPENVDIDRVTVTFKRNGEIFDKGSAANVFGSPWKALLWLVNELPKYGFRLKKDDIVLTGAMGKMTPASVGHHKASFDSFGEIEFDIT